MSTETGNTEGRLDIRLLPDDGGSRVRIHSSRPLLASRLFEGKTIASTLQTVPLLFNICGQAQGVAAVRAIESALGDPASFRVEQQREQLVQLETLREHLWRVILEWPAFTGETADKALLSELMQQIQAMRQQLDPEAVLTRQPGLQQAGGHPVEPAQKAMLTDTIAKHLFAQPDAQRLADWLAFDAKALCRWIATADTLAGRLLNHVVARGWAGLGDTDTRAMPALDSRLLVERLDADDADAFIANPSWQARNLETGPNARLTSHPLLRELHERHGQGLLPRLAARLIEIAQLALGLARDPSPAHNNHHGLGISQLEAARGRLCHRVILDGDRVQRYRILAPTEWNFRPGGPAAQALATLDAGEKETASQQAKLLIHAIDPCVSFELSVGIS